MKRELLRCEYILLNKDEWRVKNESRAKKKSFFIGGHKSGKIDT